MSFSSFTRKPSRRFGASEHAQYMRPRVVIDPACGKRMRGDDAVQLEVRGEIRWFCTEECARKFEATPWRYEDEEWVDRPKSP